MKNKPKMEEIKMKYKIDKEEDLPDVSDYEQKRILMKMDKKDIVDRYFYRYGDMHSRLCITLLIVLIFALVIGGFFGYNLNTNNSKETKELGQAICEKTLNKDFESYNDNILKCKDKEVKYEKEYDGIKIQKVE